MSEKEKMLAGKIRACQIENESSQTFSTVQYFI